MGAAISQLSPEELNQLLLANTKPQENAVQLPIDETILQNQDHISDTSPPPSLGNNQEQHSSISQSSSSLVPLEEQLVMPDGGWTTLDFEDSLEMLAFYDDQIQSGNFTPHKWQYEESAKLCKANTYTSKHPLKYALCASNGSGKDSVIVAPLAVWFILTKVRSRVVITTSSGTQLTSQTEPYISAICDKINKFHGRKILKVKQRHIVCVESGSEIRMFATDEAGKAEGYHPLEPNRDFLLIVNEAKSVDEEIHKAVKRCTGYSHFVMVSSPGEPKGSFYVAATTWPFRRTITTYDCPHSNLAELEEDKIEFGEHSAYFRSKHLALFTSIDAKVVITDDMVTKCKAFCKQWLYINWPKRVGMDLAAGGDECVVSIWQGNKRIAQDTWVERDTTISALRIHNFLLNNNISQSSQYIRADDGGVGRGIIDQLVRKGWITIKRIMNQSPAREKKAYGNKGAEMWYNFKRMVEEGFILLPTDDTKFMEQLVSRHYKQSEGSSNRIFLTSKPQEKAEGFKSPDRVDATVLAFEDLRVNDFFDTKLDAQGNIETITKQPQVSSASNLLTNEEVKERHDATKYAALDAHIERHQYANAHELNNTFTEDPMYSSFNVPTKPKAKRANGSLLSLLRNN